jgi:ERCC4-type nuclease
MIYVSGAERDPAFLELGERTNLPEEYGADFMWGSPLGLVGVQRKAFPADLLASLRDGRLGKEIKQMQELSVRYLLLEGPPYFSESGQLMYDYGHMNIQSLTNIEFSMLLNHGIGVKWTQNQKDTARVVRTLYEYTQRAEPSNLTARTDRRYGDLSSKDFAVFMVEIVPGVGFRKATAIVEGLGGTLPIRWEGTREELLKIPGIGPKIADAVLRAFGGTK